MGSCGASSSLVPLPRTGSWVTIQQSAFFLLFGLALCFEVSLVFRLALALALPVFCVSPDVVGLVVHSLQLLLPWIFIFGRLK